MVVQALIKGEGLRAIERKTGFHRDTIMRIRNMFFGEKNAPADFSSRRAPIEMECPVCKKEHKPVNYRLRYMLPDDEYFLKNLGALICARCKQSWTMYFQTHHEVVWPERLPFEEMEIAILEWLALKLEQATTKPTSETPSKRCRNWLVKDKAK